MTKLVPTFSAAAVYPTEIDLYWNNDPRATDVLIAPTDQFGDQSFNSCQITGLTPGTTYSFEIDNIAPGYATGAVAVQKTTPSS